MRTESNERPELGGKGSEKGECAKEEGRLKGYWNGILTRTKQQSEAEASSGGRANKDAPRQ